MAAFRAELESDPWSDTTPKEISDEK
jgi:hypothetical protein